LRKVKDEHIAAARESIFGPQGHMPGDRYFQKRLEGRQLMRWYFPSKYNLQDFRIDEYFEMQAERFEERPRHACIDAMENILMKVAERHEDLQSFFRDLDEASYRANPSLQDLYGLFRLVEPNRTLQFDPPNFREHSPLAGQDPPFRSAETEGQELSSLWERLRRKVNGAELTELEAKLSRMSAEEVRECLLTEARRRKVMVPMDTIVVFDDHASQGQVPSMVAEESRSVASTAEPRPRDAFEGLLGKWEFERSIPAVAIRRLADGSVHFSTVVGGDELRGAVSKDADGGFKSGLRVVGETDSDVKYYVAVRVQSLHEAIFQLSRVGATREPLAYRGIRTESLESFDDAAGKSLSDDLEKKGEHESALPNVVDRKSLVSISGRPELGGDLTRQQKEADKQLGRAMESKSFAAYVKRRHRFVDPMFRRRRLKWLERQMSGKNKEREVKYNSYYATHPDDHVQWPTNKGSVTIVFPSPYH